MKKKIKIISTNKKGFTLIEVLIYVSIFVILIVSITVFVITFTETIAKIKIKREISLAAYSAINTIIYEIKRANNIYIPASSFNNHPGQLSLETSQELPPDEKITYIDFYLDNNNRIYIRKENQSPQMLISENFRVTNLKFEYLGSSGESVRIDLSLEYDSPSPKYQYSYSLSSSASIRK